MKTALRHFPCQWNAIDRASFATFGTTSYAKPGSSFRITDVGDSGPSVSSPRYRLSKYPSAQEMCQSADHELPRTSIKRAEKQRYSCLPSRKVAKPYKSSGEWRSQTYPIRLRIYKSRNHLDPCLPLITDVRRNDLCFAKKMEAPKLSTVHHEIVKMVKCCAAKKLAIQSISGWR